MSTNFEPRIIGFLCDWCSHYTADTISTARRPIPRSIKVVGVTCTGRVDPLLLIMAYLYGADGVLVAGCWPGQCHYKEGNYHARRRMALLKNIFETLNLDAGRLHIGWVSDMEARYLPEIATEFEGQIKEQGLNAVRSEIFC
ncbi:MAG: hydrogenase iron-sulfur subunit [Chloroflexota bacterium]|nr:hydrogenase iron-sulfur subunit [Chloroflexota bacterium]